MTKRLHDCEACDGKTRHENPPKCSTCRTFDHWYEIEDSEFDD